MEEKTIIKIDALTENGVSISTKKYINYNGKEIEVFSNRKAYINSERGIDKIRQELIEPYLSGVLAVWGTEPTINENESEES